MDKRYQVFVSSTYSDLKEERTRILQTLMEMECIPSGMELFPAADEEQWEFIKKVIDDCDYYLLIIGGKYGSVAADGVSYTEKEYAREIGRKVIALVHSDPDSLVEERRELDDSVRSQLMEFREKVMSGRMVKMWERPEELPGMVALSLQRTIRLFPARGWVRSPSKGADSLLQDLNDLRKANEALTAEVSSLRASNMPNIPDIAGLEELVTLSGTYYDYSKGSSGRKSWKKELSWQELFSIISPLIMRNPNEPLVHSTLGTKLSGRRNGDLAEHDFETIKLQFMALGLITTRYLKTTDGGWAWFWSLTPSGQKKMMETRIVRSIASPDS